MKKWLRVFISGMLVGAADIVPGISGGTIAFIIGIYEELLASIASFNITAFLCLCRLKFASFFRRVAWRFLGVFVLGVALSFIALAKEIRFLLNHELYRVFLYAAFMGLVVGSITFCARLIPKLNTRAFGWLFGGAFAAYLLSGSVPAEPAFLYQQSLFEQSLFPLDLWLIICGMLAISAMLLPGISGSYILNILGVYGVVIGAVVDFVQGCKSAIFEKEAFYLLMNIGIGIMLGALCFARGINYLLAKFRSATLACLTGFMIGALKAVWPFWSYAYEPTLKVVDPILPDVTSPTFFIACGCFLVGLSAVFFVESVGNRKTNI